MLRLGKWLQSEKVKVKIVPGLLDQMVGESGWGFHSVSAST